MIFLDLREPASAWTHGLGLVLAIPGTLLLCRRAGSNRMLRLTLAVYGMSLAACYAASASYHGLRLSNDDIALLGTIDRLGIFGLIAGTYTPIAWGLLRGRWRSGVLTLAWSAMLAGCGLQLARGTLPAWVSTALYLAIGWGAVFCYGEMGRAVSRRAMRPVLVGGLLYSIGAAINLLGRPVPWPGVFGAHELFHLFVLAASMVHFRFVLRVVVPFALGPSTAMTGIRAASHPRHGPYRRDSPPASPTIRPRAPSRSTSMVQD